MGTINVEGLGIVEIEGDEPNDAEQAAIIQALSQEDAPETTDFPDTQPSTEGLNLNDADAAIAEAVGKKSEQVEQAGGFPEAGKTTTVDKDGVRITTTDSTAPTGLKSTPTSSELGLEGPTKIPREGPLGLIPAEGREVVRSKIEEQPGLLQLVTEIGPSVGGAIGGAALGAPFGPPGIVAGGVIGGLFGETVAQESGLAPSSKLNLGLSAAGPLAGPAVGGLLKGGRRVVGGGFSLLPFAKAARSKNVASQMVDEFESVGTRILAKQTGEQAKTATELYGALRNAGVFLPAKALNTSRKAMNELIDELDITRAFPESQQATQHLRNVLETIAPGRPSVILNKAGNPITVPSSISIDNIVNIRQQMGIAIRKAESAGGVKLGTAKKAFAAISDDLDRIAADPSLTGRAARLAKAAVKRAKLEFSVKDMEGAVAKFTKDAGKEGTEINIKGLQKWMRDITNPKHKNFDKNFSEALKDEIPAIKSRIAELAKITTHKGAGGPGTLVLRGRLTSAVVGGMAGFGLGGPVGSGVGALVATNIPEMLTGVLTTKTGAALLEKAARAGQGTINHKTWIAIGQLATRGVGEQKEGKTKKAIERKLGVIQ